MPVQSESSTDGTPHNLYTVGQLLLGKYRVERIIGQGGMGLVLGATHVELQHRVAIKVLLSQWAQSDKIEARFLREAQAAASLRSDNVVRVFDVGRLEDNRPYMVMEWLDGSDLSNGPMGPDLPIETAVDYIVQACDAMAAAHARKLVHRDLKPANLFLVQDEHGLPTIKLLDFGISKSRHPDNASLALTEANGIMGSPLYMAPEQVRSPRDVDARADLWSLGTILYELLTGAPPFNGDTLGAVFFALAQSKPRPLTELRSGIPLGLEATVLRCLEKDPNDRFQRAQDLQAALLPFASARSQAVLAIRTSSMPPTAKASSEPAAPTQAITGTRTTGGWTDIAPAPSARRRGHIYLAGVSSLVLVGAGLVAWSLARGNPIRHESPVSLPTNAAPAARQEPAIHSVSMPDVGGGPQTAPVPNAVQPAGDPQRTGASARPTPAKEPLRPASVKSPATPVAAGPSAKDAPAMTSTRAESTPAKKRNPLDLQFK